MQKTRLIRESALKVARNKGNARIWIEGAALSSAGFSRGDAFVVIVEEYRVRILFEKSTAFAKHADERVRHVAGTESRPIIDVCNRQLTTFFGDATHYVRRVFGDRIVCLRIPTGGAR